MVKSQKLCDELVAWLKIPLKGVARTRLLLRLDENKTGIVTLKMLQGLVGHGKLKSVILLYSSGTVFPYSKIDLCYNKVLAPAFPLLVWISDDLKANGRKATFAQKAGLSVIQLASTASAKAWIKVNKGKIIQFFAINLLERSLSFRITFEARQALQSPFHL